MRSVSLLCTLLAVTSPFVSSIPALRADSELAAHQTQSDGAPRVPLQKKGDLVPNHFHGTGSPSNGSRTYVEPRKQTTTSASSSGQMLTQGSNPDLQSLSQRFFLRTGVLYALTMVQDGARAIIIGASYTTVSVHLGDMGQRYNTFRVHLEGWYQVWFQAVPGRLDWAIWDVDPSHDFPRGLVTASKLETVTDLAPRNSIANQRRIISGRNPASFSVSHEFFLRAGAIYIFSLVTDQPVECHLLGLDGYASGINQDLVEGDHSEFGVIYSGMYQLAFGNVGNSLQYAVFLLLGGGK